MKYIQVNIETKYFTQAEPVGTLGYDMIRGNAAYQWEFDVKWLHQHRQIRLSGDLQNAGGAIWYGTFVRFSARCHAGSPTYLA
jgi:hypothetical protein